jgi:hypothetical protein
MAQQMSAKNLKFSAARRARAPWLMGPVSYDSSAASTSALD